MVFVLLVMLLVPMVSQNTAQAAEPKKMIYANTGTGDVPTADPAKVTDTSSARVTNNTGFPLIRGLEDDLNKIQPGMATKWTTSSDGLTLTFTLRKNVPWVMWDGKQVVEVKDANGKPMMVNAHDFEYGIKRTLDPRTASEYAYVFTTLIKGAEEFNSSKETGDALDKLADAVGVKAKDDWTLEITLTQPVVFALGILTLPNAQAQPKAAIEKFGDKWTEPENRQSYGPYVISEWKHDESMTLVKNPFWPGIENSPKPKIDEVDLVFLDDSASFSSYEAGSADVAIAPLPELDRIKSDPQLSKELYIGPSFGTYYYGYNVTKPPFDNVHIRRAFSYAIDRQSLIDNVIKGGQEPARWMSRPGLAGAPTLKDSPKLGISYDPEMAKKELQAGLDDMKTTVDKLPPITLVTNQVEAHVKIAQAIQQMWQDTLGVKAELTTQEWKVYLGTLQTDSPQVWRLGWNLDYPDANNFLKDVFYSTSSQNYTKWKNADFDKLVDQAAVEKNTTKRVDLYRQAEEILIVKDAAIAPIYWYTTIVMYKPYVKFTKNVSTGDERFEKWDITK
jgi:oligopeptide transport system substrate-binding protein